MVAARGGVRPRTSLSLLNQARHLRALCHLVTTGVSHSTTLCLRLSTGASVSVLCRLAGQFADERRLMVQTRLDGTRLTITFAAHGKEGRR